MPKKIDLTNRRFGRLVVIEQAENIHTPNGRSHVAWKCKCDCGKEVIVRSDNLFNDHTISCGCKQKENRALTGKERTSKLEGKQFGRLTVIEDSGKRDNRGGIIWKCQCSCGNFSFVSTSNLMRPSESTVSCGCAKSKGEERIISILLELQVPFVTQKRFENCVFPETRRQLVFDFYLPEQNLLLEYDGEQHFHEVKNDRYDFSGLQKRDAYKNQWCTDNNILLVRIPYYDFDKLTAENMRRIIERNGWREIFDEL